jgi:hypothetical protein
MASSFPKYPRLPREIKDMVWEFTLVDVMADASTLPTMIFFAKTVPTHMGGFHYKAVIARLTESCRSSLAILAALREPLHGAGFSSKSNLNETDGANQGDRPRS